MALKKFDKKQTVAVKEGKEFFKAVVTTAYKDGRCKVLFEDKSDGVYPNKDVFDFETWAKKKAEKDKKSSAKEPAKSAETSKIDDDAFNLENLSETIDNDLDGILGNSTKDKTVAEDAEFSDVSDKPDPSDDDNVFADTSSEDDMIFDQPTTDVLDGKDLKELVALIKEKGWHKDYTLNLLNTDTPEVIMEKIRANVPLEELGGTTAPDEDDVFADKGKDDAFDMGGGETAGTKKALGDADSPLLKDDDIGDDWFTYGDHEDSKYKTLKRGTVRWWIQRGEEGNLTIISDKAFTCKEHRFRLEGQTYYTTCVGGRGRRCDLCEHKNRAYVAKAMYAIDHSEYYSKKHKKKMKNQVRLVVMKPPSYEPFRAVVNRHFSGQENISLRGVQITAQRSTGEKSPAQGDIFFVNGVVKKDIFKGEYDKTLADLVKEFKPIPQDELASKIPMIEEEPAFNDK